jgi:hypothetical protein
MSFSWMVAAKSFATENLPALCSEVLEWKSTGLLHGGEGGLLREMAGMMPVDFSSAERIAETIVSDLAMERAAAPHGEAGKEGQG